MIHTHSFLVPFKPLLPHALQKIFGQGREKLALLEQELAELALPELLPSRLRLWDPAPLLPFLPHRGGLSPGPAVAPASAPLLALGGCPTAHGSWASDPCWTERTARALAQLELKMASVITNDLLHVLRRAGIPREGAAAASSCLAYLAEVDRRKSSELFVSG